MKKIILTSFFYLLITFSFSQTILPGAYQTKEYVSLLKGKRVAVFANHTAVIGKTHLVDSLLKLKINVVKAFGPEHGFRGVADDGGKVDDYIDKATGIPVISLYGKKNKPTADDLKDVDIMVFDIQDVGTRFYTFISSLQVFMEAALENDKPLIILDRPNPNGFYVDGPVLDTAYKSFVGLQPVPVVYGLTIGEYSTMIGGEHWLSTPLANKKYQEYLQKKNKTANKFSLTIIKCKNYTHKSKYILPINPSPNLPGMTSIYWYPSTCYFEGTNVSEGRGTEHAFSYIGHPAFPKDMFSFTPVSRSGATHPKFENEACYGFDLYDKNAENILKKLNGKIQLKYLLEAYKLFPDKEKFFIQTVYKSARNHFNLLAGNSTLMQQIKDGKTEAEIRASWEPALSNYKKTRKKYLLYKDFD